MIIGTEGPAHVVAVIAVLDSFAPGFIASVFRGQNPVFTRKEDVAVGTPVQRPSSRCGTPHGQSLRILHQRARCDWISPLKGVHARRGALG